MSGKTILVWFRKDLRIHDNEILTEAVRRADYILPVYCFDPRHFEISRLGTLKTGIHRASFLIESVKDLKESFRKLGSDLLVRFGRPEDILPALVAEYGVSEVYHHREVASEETSVSEAVEEALWRHRVNLRHFIGHTLYHKEDLPFPINNIPDTFGQFRKKVERDSLVRPCFDAPLVVNSEEDIDWGSIPTLQDLIPDAPDTVASTFKGGETEGLKRLKEFFWETESIKNYKPARSKPAAGFEITSALSPWIALGCLSPREMYWELKKFEQQRGNSESVYALYLQLLNRDYFRFMFKKHGNKYFHKKGFKNSPPPENTDQELHFKLWKEGRTGMPVVDAAMRQLLSTGFISNRLRSIAANFLVSVMGVNWTWGASWFEENLLDYCPANNWGNWASVAGVALDSRSAHPNDFLKAGRDADPTGDYIRQWIPELSGVATPFVHQPWIMDEKDRIVLKYPGLPVSLRDEIQNIGHVFQ